ncbi:MAG TPA: hypothetical protein VGV14_01535 [Rhodanobacter sp.]|nr:hypothetical protein [Rhodanobacter sp.]
MTHILVRMLPWRLVTYSLPPQLLHEGLFVARLARIFWRTRSAGVSGAGVP